MSFARQTGAALAALLASAASAAGPACEALSHADGSVRAEAIAAGTTIPGGSGEGTLPPYCRIRGVLKPEPGSRIGFELWLPDPERWTGRYQMLGNGGYSSTLPLGAMAQALARGSAAIATDTGHEGDDPEFARGRPQAIVDWGWRAVHLSALAGKKVVQQYYGRPAERSYFNGCSTGGHQGMMEAQRFPADFDGIVAGAPGSNRVRLNSAFLWQYLANHPGRDGSRPVLDGNDLRLLAASSLLRCRAANGAAAGGLSSDKWLNDPLGCRPDPAILLCRAGGPSPCLSSEKVMAAQAMYAGARDPRSGRRVTFPWLPGSEPGWSGYWADPREPTQPARVNLWRFWAFDNPTWDWWSFDFRRDLRVAMSRLSPLIDATDPDLRAFRARGGRLLQYHGLADPVVSPLDTLAYRHAVLRRSGTRGEDWFRLFLVPGMGHCSGGEGFNRFDAQAAIERWVEEARAPQQLLATNSTGTTRPLCPYPQRAIFRGGNPGEARSFVCSMATKTSR